MKNRTGVAIAALLAAGACGGNPAPSTGRPTPPATTSTGTPASGAYNPVIDPTNFVAKIDNPYLPFIPGTTFVYRGASDGEAEVNTVKVTALTKTILGVTCVVVEDIVEVNGELHEKTLDWYAQDRDGNVWYFGEDRSSRRKVRGKPASVTRSPGS